MPAVSPEGGQTACLRLPSLTPPPAVLAPPTSPPHLPAPFHPSLPRFVFNSLNSYFFLPIFIYRPNSIIPTIKGGKSPTMPPPRGINSFPFSAPFQTCPGTKLAIIFTELWFPFCLPRPPDGLGAPGLHLHCSSTVSLSMWLRNSVSSSFPKTTPPLPPCHPMPGARLVPSKHLASY